MCFLCGWGAVSLQAVRKALCSYTHLGGIPGISLKAKRDLAFGQGCDDGHNSKMPPEEQKVILVQLGCFCFSCALRDSGRSPGLPVPMLSFLSTWSSANLNPNTPSYRCDPRKARASKDRTKVKFKVWGGLYITSTEPVGGFWCGFVPSCLV